MMIKEHFEDFLVYLRKIGRSPKTIRENKRFLEEAIAEAVGDMDVSEFRVVHLARIIHSGRMHGAYGSQRTVSVFRVYWRFLYESGIPNLPCHWRDIKIPRGPAGPAPEYLTPEEFETLLESFNPTRIEELRMRALIELLVATGMRIGEALPLNKQDIDWTNNEVKIINCKSKQPEKVLLSERAKAWLDRYIRGRLDDEDYLFRGNDGGRLTYTSAKGYFRRVVLELRFKKRVRFHILRKTFCTWLLMNQTDIRTVQHLARHKSERTTLKHYAALDIDRAKDQHRIVFNRMLVASPTKTVYNTPICKADLKTLKISN
ncbi:MAG TPA: tyrosine-type recombinase/integrase [Patescibacteria group bacterium]|nr:tyrosine-type recombinase/integrase [Patescibacteria group bacterium]